MYKKGKHSVSFIYFPHLLFSSASVYRGLVADDKQINKQQTVVISQVKNKREIINVLKVPIKIKKTGRNNCKLVFVTKEKEGSQSSCKLGKALITILSPVVSFFSQKVMPQETALLLSESDYYSLILPRNSCLSSQQFPDQFTMRLTCRLHQQTLSRLGFVPQSKDVSMSEVQQLQEFLLRTTRLLVITGAGLSTESGIPDYRSEGVGLYARTDR